MSGQETKQRLTEKALVYFSQHDYQGSSLDEISKELGVTKGAIYHHFDGKDQLFLAAVRLLLSTLSGILDSYFESDAPLDAVLKQVGRLDSLKAGVEDLTGITSVLANYDRFLYMLTTGMKKFPELQESIGRIYQRFIKNITFELSRAIQRGEIRQDTDVEAVAFELTAFYEGTLLLDVAGVRVDNGELIPRVIDSIMSRIRVSELNEEEE